MKIILFSIRLKLFCFYLFSFIYFILLLLIGKQAIKDINELYYDSARIIQRIVSYWYMRHDRVKFYRGLTAFQSFVRSYQLRMKLREYISYINDSLNNKTFTYLQKQELCIIMKHKHNICINLFDLKSFNCGFIVKPKKIFIPNIHCNNNEFNDFNQTNEFNENDCLFPERLRNERFRSPKQISKKLLNMDNTDNMDNGVSWFQSPKNNSLNNSLINYKTNNNNNNKLSQNQFQTSTSTSMHQNNQFYRNNNTQQTHTTIDNANEYNENNNNSDISEQSLSMVVISCISLQFYQKSIIGPKIQWLPLNLIANNTLLQLFSHEIILITLHSLNYMDILRIKRLMIENTLFIWNNIQNILIYGTNIKENGLLQLISLGISHLTKFSINSVGITSKLGTIIGTQLLSKQSQTLSQPYRQTYTQTYEQTNNQLSRQTRGQTQTSFNHSMTNTINHSNLTALYIENELNFKDSGFNDLLLLLQRNYTLKILVIRNCNLTSLSIPSLGRYLPLTQTLEILNISDNNYNMNDIKQLIIIVGNKGNKGIFQSLFINTQKIALKIEELELLYNYSLNINSIRLIIDNNLYNLMKSKVNINENKHILTINDNLNRQFVTQKSIYL